MIAYHPTSQKLKLKLKLTHIKVLAKSDKCANIHVNIHCKMCQTSLLCDER